MSQELKELLRSVLKEEIEPINKQLKTLEQGVKMLEQDVKELKDGQNKILKVIGQIPAQYESLEQFVGNQERVIEALSYRSLKHESEIKDLNRLIKNQ